MEDSECPWELKKEGDGHCGEVRVPMGAEKLVVTVTKKLIVPIEGKKEPQRSQSPYFGIQPSTFTYSKIKKQLKILLNCCYYNY
ncbi:hypothetical protein BAVI_01590 [Neobacillus vireti LMG 21834]|uniref:Uncharacterized protein n=1 Tax=Neobacillus vireti LMG 21834 TaxID=1131730 RepID=A0AB94IU60_9BACI|nr:hypothetical protein BAVI_01590 [Neobacillus vireti LMG 21834]KLT15301.1 hypothetical protein AA980_24340 [Neobacillus vireti]